MGQPELNELSIRVMAKFDELLDYFGIDLAMSRRMYYGACPVHGGDKDNAVNIFHTGRSYVGNWKCHTMQCEQFFRPSVIGFVRGVLSHQRHGWENPSDETVSFYDTVQFLMDFIGEKEINTIDQQVIEKNKFVQAAALFAAPENIQGIDRNHIKSALQIPAKYYLQRGYSSEILKKFDVGLCTNRDKPMYNRVVVPVYDDSYTTMVGCTGRTIFDKCEKCDLYHGLTERCPSEDYRRAARYAKWRHSEGFQGESYLYNYWNAKRHIIRSRVAVIVEGPGDIWRLAEAGIDNGVGVFGTAISDGQQVLLDSSGALALVVATDNDAAGNKAFEIIKEQCSRYYYVYRPEIPIGDIGDMTIEQIKQTILPVVEQATKDVS